MRSYREYCALAKSLDVVGDRWTLLVVRELALRGECRYSDLQDGLPGISTNLLADRLRELEAAGVLERHEPRPPLATAVFTLTEHGRALEPILRQLMGWGVPYMIEGPEEGDHFKARWLTWPVEQFLTDRRPEDPPARIELDTGAEPIELGVQAGRVIVSDHPAGSPDARVSGSPHSILGLITGYVTLAGASEHGLRLEGERGTLERVFAA